MTYSPVFLIILYVTILCPLLVSAQIEQEQRLHEVNQHIIELEQHSGMELPPAERLGLEHELERLRLERRDLEEFLKRHEIERGKQLSEPHDKESGEKPVAQSGDNGKNGWKSSVVIAAIITSLGGIVVALIGLIRSKRN